MTVNACSGHVHECVVVLVPHDGRRATVRVHVIPVTHVAQGLQTTYTTALTQAHKIRPLNRCNAAMLFS